MEILRKFKDHPYAVLADDKEYKKLMAAVNKSLKLLRNAHSRKKERERRS